MRMIRRAPPVEGRREPICKTDEATVSRIRAPGTPYDCMVERLQKIPCRLEGEGTGYPPEFVYKYGQGRLGNVLTQLTSGITTQYHILKFLALGATRLLFPHNLVNAPELRLFERDGTRYAATYSDFVPDENGAMERQKEARRRFDNAEKSDEEKSIRESADLEERKRNPALEPLVKKIEMDGTFLLPHPEANYHLANGNTVFFEVQGVDMEKVLMLATRLRKYPETNDVGTALLEIAAAIHATALSYWVGCWRESWERTPAPEWTEMDFYVLREKILSAYLRLDHLGLPALGLMLVRDGIDVLKDSCRFRIIDRQEKISSNTLIIEPGVSDFL